MSILYGAVLGGFAGLLLYMLHRIIVTLENLTKAVCLRLERIEVAVTDSE